ncbi:MAG: patatin-like phospholipase family protein [Candidatus Nitrosocosmicus sp.]
MFKDGFENVLILQGMGSLGAFGCGVYKALVKNNIDLDIVAGTSIGGINATIIASNTNKEHSEEILEDFWLELSEGFVDIDTFSIFLVKIGVLKACNPLFTIVFIHLSRLYLKPLVG